MKLLKHIIENQESPEDLINKPRARSMDPKYQDLGVKNLVKDIMNIKDALTSGDKKIIFSQLNRLMIDPAIVRILIHHPELFDTMPSPIAKFRGRSARTPDDIYDFLAGYASRLEIDLYAKANRRYVAETLWKQQIRYYLQQEVSQNHISNQFDQEEYSILRLYLADPDSEINNFTTTEGGQYIKKDNKTSAHLDPYRSKTDLKSPNTDLTSPEHLNEVKAEPLTGGGLYRFKEVFGNGDPIYDEADTWEELFQIADDTGLLDAYTQSDIETLLNSVNVHRNVVNYVMDLPFVRHLEQG